MALARFVLEYGQRGAVALVVGVSEGGDEVLLLAATVHDIGELDFTALYVVERVFFFNRHFIISTLIGKKF